MTNGNTATCSSSATPRTTTSRSTTTAACSTSPATRRRPLPAQDVPRPQGEPDNPDEITNLTTLFGGTGSNRYEYLQNAPVVINGGSGIDTIVIIGTPIDDTFIITDTYIAGAGRIVTFTNIESIEVDGGGGDDRSGSSAPATPSRRSSTAARATTRSTSAARRRRSSSTRRRSPTRRRRSRSRCRRRSSGAGAVTWDLSGYTFTVDLGTGSRTAARSGRTSATGRRTPRPAARS